VAGVEREFFIDNLLARIHFSIVMIRWTGLAPWVFEFPFPGSLTSTFLWQGYTEYSFASHDAEEVDEWSRGLAACSSPAPPMVCLRLFRPEMCCGTEAGSYLRLIDSCITQFKAQGPSRTCNESKEESHAAEEVDEWSRGIAACSSPEPPMVCRRLLFFFFFITLKPRVE